MRLGGPLFAETNTPEDWISALRAEGYSAAFCPLDQSAPDEVVAQYEAAARQAGIVIAEVGAWSNPLSPDDATRQQAIAHCQGQLALAERIGARCCVNIAGSRGPKWDGPCAADLTEETFAIIVATTREIIDAVRPARTCWTLETMPWMYPDSPDSYLRLLEAVDRDAFAVHFDAVNLVNSPQRYFASGDLVREFVAKLGPQIRCCHLKDVQLSDNLTVHLDEVRPGLGGLDYPALLQALDTLDPDLPCLLEHLPEADEYRQAAAHVRAVAERSGVRIS